MRCRSCGAELELVWADLGAQPLANSYLKPEQLNEPEVYYPLKVFVCQSCWLVQTLDFRRGEEIFVEDYAYFSSYSSSWLEHARTFVDTVTDRLSLGASSRVMEIASNDGYLLQYVVRRGIPCFGVEPTACTARAARQKGVETLERFWGSAVAQEVLAARGPQDLVVGNNVLAHVPDINDFVAGIRLILAPGGTVTMEFQHVQNIIDLLQFDTIYHEHFSYLSLTSVEPLMARHGLEVYDVEKVPTHGGSLRLFIKHAANGGLAPDPRVAALRAEERAFGLTAPDVYRAFMPRVEKVKHDLLAFLLEQNARQRRVAAYGAAAKGNTFLNYCGVRGTDLVAFVVDVSPHKQGKYLPGSRLPIRAPAALKDARPDRVLILPWNIKAEVVEQHQYVHDWGGRFVVAIPALQEV
jgi:hypothetical protein